MTTVTNTLVNETNTPLSDILIEVTLVTEVGQNAFVGDVQIASRVTVRTDGDGQWSLDLFPNADISPAGTQYRVRQFIPGFFDQVTVFTVPVEGATPVPYSLSELI